MAVSICLILLSALVMAIGAKWGFVAFGYSVSREAQPVRYWVLTAIATVPGLIGLGSLICGARTY